MDQMAGDPSSLNRESNRGAGSVCYIALHIFLEWKWPGFESHLASFFSEKKNSSFCEVLHEG